MKKIKLSIGMALLSFSMLSAQFFENYQQTEEPQSSGFFENNNPNPEYGGDNWGEGGNPTTPGPEAPIDDWIFLLPLLGVAVGGYYLLKHRRENVTE